MSIRAWGLMGLMLVAMTAGAGSADYSTMKQQMLRDLANSPGWPRMSLEEQAITRCTYDRALQAVFYSGNPRSDTVAAKNFQALLRDPAKMSAFAAACGRREFDARQAAAAATTLPPAPPAGAGEITLKGVRLDVAGQRDALLAQCTLDEISDLTRWCLFEGGVLQFPNFSYGNLEFPATVHVDERGALVLFEIPIWDREILEMLHLLQSKYGRPRTRTDRDGTAYIWTDARGSMLELTPAPPHSFGWVRMYSPSRIAALRSQQEAREAAGRDNL